MTPAPPAGPRRRRAVNASGGTSEATFQRQAVALLHYFDWRVYHAPAGGKAGRVDTEQIGRGFPDLVAVKAPRLLFAELKPEQGSQRVTKAVAETRPPGYQHRDLDDAQADWLLALEDVADAVTAAAENARAMYSGASVEVYLWRPSDLERIAGIAGAGENAYRLETALAYARGLAS